MTMQPVLHSFAYTLDYLREQVADVPEADMVAQPHGITNHPAWVIGHLTCATQMLAGAGDLSRSLSDQSSLLGLRSRKYQHVRHSRPLCLGPEGGMYARCCMLPTS